MLLRGPYGYGASAPVHVSAHPERRKSPEEFTEDDRGIFQADLLAEDPALFRRLGGEFIEVTMEDVVSVLQGSNMMSILEGLPRVPCMDEIKGPRF